MRYWFFLCLVVSSILTYGCADDKAGGDAPIVIIGGADGAGGVGGSAGAGGEAGRQADAGSDSDMDVEPDMMVEPSEPILVPEFGRSAERRILVQGRRADGLSHPRDLQFEPDAPNNLWVVDRDWDGNIILNNAGQPDQTIERMRDMAASHFMEEVSGVAFSDRGSFATCQESRNSMDGFGFPDNFMGPALWSTDLMIHCNVNQNMGGPLNGSHLDMLHQSPLCMGITHEEGHAFFVTDGANGHVVRYDFREPHIPGGDDHSDGHVTRYGELEFTRVPGIPSHLFLKGDELYYADTGTGTIKVADISTGRIGGRLEPENEPLAVFNFMRDVQQRVFAEGLDAPSGLVVTDERVFVSLPTTGEIVAFGLDGVEIERIDTGAPGVMGLEMGPNGRLWFVNADHGTVNVIEPGPMEMPEPEFPIRPNMGDCMYPSFGTPRVGAVMPPYTFSDARRRSQSIGALRAIDMFCDAEWDGVSVIIFVAVTEWMPWVPEYIAYIDALSPQIEEAGGRIVYVGAQNARWQPWGTRATDRFINEYDSVGNGIRTGSADDISLGRLVDSPLFTHLPSAFVVRRSDMVVLATQRGRMMEHLPYVEMAQDPDADWSNPGPATIRPVIPSNCEVGDDEEYEPNDTIDTAATIGEVTFSGGVCARQGDFYDVELEGNWRLDLSFSHAVGDLDLVLLRNGNLLRDRNGQPIGANSGDDNERLDWRGPVTIYIYGYEGATAPYRFNLSRR